MHAHVLSWKVLHYILPYQTNCTQCYAVTVYANKHFSKHEWHDINFPGKKLWHESEMIYQQSLITIHGGWYIRFYVVKLKSHVVHWNYSITYSIRTSCHWVFKRFSLNSMEFSHVNNKPLHGGPLSFNIFFLNGSKLGKTSRKFNQNTKRKCH